VAGIVQSGDSFSGFAFGPLDNLAFSRLAWIWDSVDMTMLLVREFGACGVQSGVISAGKWLRCKRKNSRYF